MEKFRDICEEYGQKISDAQEDEVTHHQSPIILVCRLCDEDYTTSPQSYSISKYKCCPKCAIKEKAAPKTKFTYDKILKRSKSRGGKIFTTRKEYENGGNGKCGRECEILVKRYMNEDWRCQSCGAKKGKGNVITVDNFIKIMFPRGEAYLFTGRNNTLQLTY